MGAEHIMSAGIMNADLPDVHSSTEHPFGNRQTVRSNEGGTTSNARKLLYAEIYRRNITLQQKYISESTLGNCAAMQINTTS